MLAAGLSCGIPVTEGRASAEFDEAMQACCGGWLDKVYLKFANRVEKKLALTLSLDAGHVSRLKARALQHKEAQEYIDAHPQPRGKKVSDQCAAAQALVADADGQIDGLLSGALGCRALEISEAAELLVNWLIDQAVKSTSPAQLPKAAKHSMLKQQWLLLAFWCRGVGDIKAFLRESYAFVDFEYVGLLEGVIDGVYAPV